MGCDKAWLAYQGQSLIAHQLETVRQLRPVATFVSARTLPSVELDSPVLLDNFAGQGPLAGIEKAMEVMPSELLLVLAVDMPRVSSTVLDELLCQCADGTGSVPRFVDGIEPLAAFYPKAAHPTLRALLGKSMNTAAHFAETCVNLGLARFYDLARPRHAQFANWNSPADLPPSVRVDLRHRSQEGQRLNALFYDGQVTALRPAELSRGDFREPVSQPVMPGHPDQ